MKKLLVGLLATAGLSFGSGLVAHADNAHNCQYYKSGYSGAVHCLQGTDPYRAICYYWVKGSLSWKYGNLMYPNYFGDSSVCNTYPYQVYRVGLYAY